MKGVYMGKVDDTLNDMANHSRDENGFDDEPYPEVCSICGHSPYSGGSGRYIPHD